jgi:penicillin-insensitive murein endopeptidase
MDYWFSEGVLHPKPPPVAAPPRPPMTMAALPKTCRAVVDAP